MSPAGSRYGRVAMRLSTRLGQHIESQRLGVAFTAETGFFIERDPDTVRVVDLAFVVAARAAEADRDGFFPGPPDLAVEVLSPSERASEVAEKIEMWLTCGCREVWVVDPRRQSASIHRLVDGRVTSVETDMLANEELLPGFQLPLSELFA